MNSEHPDEIQAKQIVQQVLGITLLHADKTGGVDYRSTDGQIAVEITRVKSEKKVKGLKALQQSHRVPNPPGDLQNCWVVFASDTRYGLRTLASRVHPLTMALEIAGLSTFDEQPAVRHIRRQDVFSGIYSDLLRAGVQRASALPRCASSHAHRVIVLTGSGGSASDSDAAVRLLSDALARKPDNFQKLEASGANQRHLFVWLDEHTQYGISRALSHPATAEDEEAFGMPTRPPTLDSAVTNLWVVHEGSRRGWLWDGCAWRQLENRAASQE